MILPIERTGTLSDTDAQEPAQRPDPPPGAPVYETSWLIRTGDIDSDQRLRLDGVARYLQDIGYDNLVAFGFYDTHPIWMVRRTVIDIVRPVVWPDRVVLRRWCSALSSRWLSMRVQIAGASRGLIETEAFWINMNAQTGTPSRISDDYLALVTPSVTDTRLRWRRQLDDVPAGTSSHEFALRRADIDPFGHLNNAVYLQALDNELGDRPDLLNGPSRTVIEYLAPIRTKDVVQVAVSESTTSLWASLTVGDDYRAHARIALLP